MKYIEFGKNNVSISSVILGMMRISSLSAKEVEKLIDTALDSGINPCRLLCRRAVREDRRQSPLFKARLKRPYVDTVEVRYQTR